MNINIKEIIQQPDWLSKINDHNFSFYALSIFKFQYQNNLIYRQYVDAIHVNPEEITDIQQIPFLPILFFKTQVVKNGTFTPDLIFESSGTTGTINSKHFIKDVELYKQSFLMTFKKFYGHPHDYDFFCLLPSYLERQNSSLVYMAKELIDISGGKSDFFLHDFEKLKSALEENDDSGKKKMLLGVTFALLDFAAAFPMDLSDVIVMETGGMKGRRSEWSRDQVHDFLKEKWNLQKVHSEYGMTELLSQAYSKGAGLFQNASTMKTFVRSETDPFEINNRGSGCLNIIDLANVHSCSFIATDDIARIHEHGEFEVLGRIDHSALRGCSLMVL